MLESFNYLQPEDLYQTLAMYDDRLVTVKNLQSCHVYDILDLYQLSI